MANAPVVADWMGDVDPSQIGFPFTVDKRRYTKQMEVAYKSTPAGRLHLDVYRPVGAGPYPVVVMIHGGGWARGGRFDMGLSKWAGYLAEAGLAVVSIDYRLAPATTYPDSFQDCLDAVDWVVDRAAEYDLDPGRMGLWGDSAGGHLVLLVATSQTNPAFTGPRLRSGGKRLRAVVAFYPPTDLIELQRAIARGPVPNPIVRDFVGVDPDADPARWREASPIEHVHQQLPPTLVLQGTRDFLVPHWQATSFAERMAAVGARCQLEMVENGVHGFDRVAPNARARALIERSRAFLVEHLRE